MSEVPEVRLFLFGTPRLQVNDLQVEFATRKTLALFIYLAYEGTACRRDALVNLLWPEADDLRGRAALRSTLVRLNTRLPSGTLETNRQSIGISQNRKIWIDVVEFQRGLAECRQHGHPESEVCPACQPWLEKVVELFQADFMSGFTLPDSANFDDWQLTQSEKLQQDLLTALDRLIQCLVFQREFDKALLLARRRLSLDRLDEAAHCTLMCLNAWMGQPHAALRQYQVCKEVLYSQLGVEPQETTSALYHRIKKGEIIPLPVSSTWKSHKKQIISTPEPTPPVVKHHLPVSISSFIGREQELHQLTQLVAVHRLVTLTGSGGVGKTRLAIETGTGLAETYTETFPDGVWLVELARLGNPDLVTAGVLEGLGLQTASGMPDETRLIEYLKPKHLLIILDNCEHLISESRRLSALLLKNCPGLHLLVTSREVLSIEGEYLFRVPSLAVPDITRLPGIEQIAQVEAVRLFIERARQASPGFQLDASNSHPIAMICRRLDGIPLALELAAGRLNVLTPQQIAARLSYVFQLLSKSTYGSLPHHQTLKATIEWSYDLLLPKERLVLQFLSTFAGSWSLEAAEEICSDESENGIQRIEVLDLLAGLVDKSLIGLVPQAQGAARYTLLETVRQYALEKLTETGHTPAVRDRHLGYYMRFAEACIQHIHGAEQKVWLHRLDEELDNLRQALGWGLTISLDIRMQDQPAAMLRLEYVLRLVSSLFWFWHIAHEQEGVNWKEKLLSLEAAMRGNQALVVGVQSPDYLRSWCRTVNTLVYNAYFNPGALSLEKRRELLQESIQLCQALGESASQELALGLIVMGRFFSRPIDQSIDYLEQSLAISRQKQYAFEEREALIHLSALQKRTGHFQEGMQSLEESLEICQRTGDLDGIATNLYCMSALFRNLGEYAQAKKCSLEGRKYFQAAGNLGACYYTEVDFLLDEIELGVDPQAFTKAEIALDNLRNLQEKKSLWEALITMSQVYWSLGKFDQAQAYAREALEISLAMPSEKPHHSLVCFLSMARLELSQGNLAEAGQHFSEILVLNYTDFGPTSYDMLPLYDGVAIYCINNGQIDHGLQMFASIDNIYQLFKFNLLPRQRLEHEQALNTARKAMGEEAYHTAWEAGRILSPESLLERAQIQSLGG